MGVPGVFYCSAHVLYIYHASNYYSYACYCFTSSETATTQKEPSSITDVVCMLRKKIVQEESTTIPIRRGHVLEDALRAVKRKSFNSIYKVTVNWHVVLIQLAPLPL